jgi:hypothetical protein
VKLRTFLFVMMPLFFMNVSAQTEQTKLFRKKEYFNGIFYRQTIDTIKVKHEQIDVYFFRHHFNAPYYLPAKFVDKRHKNVTISIWHAKNGKKEYQHNWKNTYTYDNLGRLVKFTYSACAICSQLPYSYSVKYNSIGKVKRLLQTNKEDFKFYYNNKGAIVKFEKYLFEQLEMKIELLN